MQFLPISKNVNNYNNYACVRSLQFLNSCRFNSVLNFPMLGRKSNSTMGFPDLLNMSRHIHLSVIHKSEVDGDVHDMGIEDVSIAFPLREAVDIEEHSEHFRNTLYPDSKDPLMLEIKTCNSIELLLDILKDNEINLKSEHYCQTILVLWDLLTSFGDVVFEPGGRPISIPVSKYLSNSKNHSEYILFSDLSPILFKALAFISSDLKRLSTESLVCSILYSNRLGVSMQHPYIQALFTEVVSLLGMEDENQFSISALSRLTLVLSDFDDYLWAKLSLIKTLPLLYKHFGK